ncbi:MAG: replication-associated recombination protein A [Oscillospiraceae bacterium]|jgi:putative ATPase|nr:replication-associated recombination protein A [Oscillospiraceae bacterium]
MSRPLADRLRPQTLEEVFGQRHLLAQGRPLWAIIKSGRIPNLIFYGPSGVGKTTVAGIIAAQTNKRLHRLNGTTASLSDIREIVSEIDTLTAPNGILLYLDEIQYFNKKQQQSLLEFIENGDITLVASTTENPHFYIYNAVLSRSTVFEFKSLTTEDAFQAVTRAVEFLSRESGQVVKIEEAAAKRIAFSCGGDVRRAINAVEICVLAAPIRQDAILITADLAAELTQTGGMKYDRAGDEHYDIVSAYQKSMRGSDPDAALHYLGRLLEAGDLPSACRRLMVCACEDVGLAYPQIIPIVKACVDAAFMLGLPEARIPLADAVALVASSPKSNSAYLAVDEALEDIRKGLAGPIPRALQNKHFDGADHENKGQFYQYPHDFPKSWVNQQYLPDSIKNRKYMRFGDNKTERAFSQYLESIKR